MTIADEIEKLQSNLSDSYTACQGKGATMPADENFDNLADCIDSIQTGSTPVISSLNVTPTTSVQTITAPSGTDGYSPVNVSAVTSAIDNNITAENIKNGVSILGVSGSVTELQGETKTVTPTTSQQTITPSAGKNGITQVTVNAVTSAVDNNIQAGNIKKDVTILGVTGTYEGGNSSKYGATIDNILGNVNYNGEYMAPTGQVNLVFNGIKSFGGTAQMGYKFRSLNNIISVTFPDLEYDGASSCLEYAFSYCSNLTTASFPKLDRLYNWTPLQYCFNSCTSLTSASFPLLTSVTAYGAFQYCFYGCSALTSVDFPSLTQIGDSAPTGSNPSHFANAFYNCNNLTTLTFPELTSIYCTASINSYGTFYRCNKIEKMYFPKLSTITYGSGASSSNQNACKYIFYNCDSLTELHFGAANETAIKSTDGWSTAWGRGAGNVTIYFDL